MNAAMAPSPFATRRRVTNYIMLSLSAASFAACVGVLFAIVAYVFINGVSALNLDFFTQEPKPVGEPGGGVAPAIMGTLIMVGMASLIGIPVGLGIGIFVSEFAPPRLGDIVRFVADVLAGVPSVVIGIFAYVVIVLQTNQFSAYAGAFSLAIIMLPIVARSSEEMLKLVPNSQREAAYALGIPRWRSIVSVVLPAAARGLLTAAVLSVARAAGESAPLLFTALGSRFTPTSLDDLNSEMDALPIRIYRYAISPFNQEHDQAWAAALILIFIVLLFNIFARTVLGREPRRR